MTSSRGILAVADRRDDFSRVYDLAERIVPTNHHGREVERDEAQRELLRQAARANGVGTPADLADYFRMSMREVRPRLAELVEARDLRLVRVEGWREPAYLRPEATFPKRIEASTLLSPFDPLIWHRPRVERLFDFEYRFEIFVPAEKRGWGCYVLPHNIQNVPVSPAVSGRTKEPEVAGPSDTFPGITVGAPFAVRLRLEIRCVRATLPSRTGCGGVHRQVQN